MRRNNRSLLQNTIFVIHIKGLSKTTKEIRTACPLADSKESAREYDQEWSLLISIYMFPAGIREHRNCFVLGVGLFFYTELLTTRHFRRMTLYGNTYAPSRRSTP